MSTSMAGNQHGPEGQRPPGRPLLLAASFIGLVCGFIGIFIGLSLGGLRELRNTAALRADPVAATLIEKRLGESEGSLLLIGDSRVSQWAPLPEIDGVRADAIGVPGLAATQLSGALGLIDPDLHGRTVLVQIGINDLKSIGYSHRTPAEIMQSTREAITSIHDQLERCGARVFVMTIIPPGPVPFSRRFIWTDEINQSVRAINADLVAGALVPTDSILDLRGLLGDESTIDPRLAHDTLYISADAYEQLNPAVIESAKADPTGAPVGLN
ncbi:MAG: hypothetical protein VX641_02775 [Planctomycetota bacterium]|nr:hypothetical protein [Planctomycetota bacterium]